MDKNVKSFWDSKEQLASLKGTYPFWNVPRKYKIVKCSNPDYWYVDKIGEIIEVKRFGTFGSWDVMDRWVDFWDLKPIE